MINIKYLLLLLLFGLSLTSQAQESFSPEMSFGVRQGANYSGVYADPGIVQSEMLRYSGGVSFKYSVEKYRGIQIEINYEQYGWREPNPYLPEYYHKVDYIDIPVFAQLYVGMKNRILLNIGPTISFKVWESQTRVDPDSPGYMYHYNKDAAGFDYSITGGLGYARTFSFGTLQLEGRYKMGLISMFEQNIEEEFETARHQVINVSLLYFYRKK